MNRPTPQACGGTSSGARLAAIEIAGEDAISEDGREVYSMLRGAGVDCVLIRDITDSMHDPRRPPYVNHDEGTQLLVEHVEKHWCPTTTSDELAALLKG